MKFDLIVDVPLCPKKNEKIGHENFRENSKVNKLK
jgi:hypothetical protein